jgi:hypothetical protein
MMITVEEQEDIEAFKSYVAEASAGVAPVIEAPTPKPKVEEKKVEAPRPVAVPVVAPIAAPVVAPVVSPVAVVNNASIDNGFNNARWGTGVSEGALANKLSSDQHVYLEKYGRSSHQPINKI